MKTYGKGVEFGDIVLLGEVEKRKNHVYEKILCRRCGNVKYVRQDSIKKRKTCGCFWNNPYGLERETYEKLYDVWNNMIKRCYNPKSDRYYTYGAKGIRVCEEWKNDFHEYARWALKNGWNKGLSIERKDYNKNYCPENCKFITMKEQARNKRTNVVVEHKGEKRCVAEWCEILGLEDKTIYRRIALGHTDPEIILYKGDLRSLKGKQKTLET